MMPSNKKPDLDIDELNKSWAPTVKGYREFAEMCHQDEIDRRDALREKHRPSGYFDKK